MFLPTTDIAIPFWGPEEGILRTKRYYTHGQPSGGYEDKGLYKSEANAYLTWTWSIASTRITQVILL